MDEIRQADSLKTDLKSYRKQLADCVVLTHDKKIYLQRRPDTWGKHAGVVNLFGGHVEEGENATQAVIRELNEETGGIIEPKYLVFVGAVTEGWTNHTEIVHVYFWHDTKNTITGCYEAEPISFDTVEEALAHPKLMDYARWALTEYKNRGFL